MDNNKLRAGPLIIVSVSTDIMTKTLFRMLFPLLTFGSAFGQTDFNHPGDIVCWNLGGGLTHIGIVSRKKSSDGQRFLIVHNIGAGQVTEDILFEYKIIGHYEFGN